MEEEADFADKDPSGRYIRVRFPNPKLFFFFVALFELALPLILLRFFFVLFSMMISWGEALSRLCMFF